MKRVTLALAALAMIGLATQAMADEGRPWGMPGHMGGPYGGGPRITPPPMAHHPEIVRAVPTPPPFVHPPVVRPLVMPPPVVHPPIHQLSYRPEPPHNGFELFCRNFSLLIGF